MITPSLLWWWKSSSWLSHLFRYGEQSSSSAWRMCGFSYRHVLSGSELYAARIDLLAFSIRCSSLSVVALTMTMADRDSRIPIHNPYPGAGTVSQSLNVVYHSPSPVYVSLERSMSKPIPSIDALTLVVTDYASLTRRCHCHHLPPKRM